MSCSQRGDRTEHWTGSAGTLDRQQRDDATFFASNQHGVVDSGSRRTSRPACTTVHRYLEVAGSVRATGERGSAVAGSLGSLCATWRACCSRPGCRSAHLVVHSDQWNRHYAASSSASTRGIRYSRAGGLRASSRASRASIGSSAYTKSIACCCWPGKLDKLSSGASSGSSANDDLCRRSSPSCFSCRF